jgi:hypothetical protein
MHQLQQKEKVAHYNLRSEAIQCVQLDSQVYSIQKNFLRELQNVADMSANYENMVRKGITLKFFFFFLQKTHLKSDLKYTID